MDTEQDLSGVVSYHDVNAMVRLGQRQELEAYFRQFVRDIETLAKQDMRLAKSRVISLVTAMVVSILEIGAPPQTEGQIADAAGKVTHAETVEELVALAEFYAGHMNVCARPNSNRYATQIIERCKAIIASDFSKDISDEYLAEQVNLSRSHFRYLFKAVTGIPFKRYLSGVRLTAARGLVLESSLSIKEICSEVGYADMSSFYRAYRSFHGVPPTAHRLPSV